MRLDQWSLVTRCDSPGNFFRAPKGQYPAISGLVTGSPVFEDHKVITTSPLDYIEALDPWTQVAVTKSGSRYQLGTPDLRYLKDLENRSSSLDKALAPYRKTVKPTREDAELALEVICQQLRESLVAEGLDPETLEFTEALVARYREYFKIPGEAKKMG